MTRSKCFIAIPHCGIYVIAKHLHLTKSNVFVAISPGINACSLRPKKLSLN